MPRRGNREIIFFVQNKLLNMRQKAGHSRVEMVNKKQRLRNLDPTTTLADLLFASHSLFVGTYYYICCWLYVSGFDFLGKKLQSKSKLNGGDSKNGLTMHSIYPAPTLPEPLPCWVEVIMADPPFPAIWIIWMILFVVPTLSTILTYYKLEQLYHRHRFTTINTNHLGFWAEIYFCEAKVIFSIIMSIIWMCRR